MNFYNKDFGTSFSFEDSQNWSDLIDLTHFDSLADLWDWSSDQDGHSIFWHLDPFPGAVEAVQSFADVGHHIIG